MAVKRDHQDRTGAAVVERYLRQRLQRRTWTVGSRLPSIRQLADKLKISPTTVHLVIAKLAAEGQLEIRPRSGAYVAAPSKRTSADAGAEPTTIGFSFLFGEEGAAASAESWSNRIVDAARRTLDASRIDTLMLAHWDETAAGVAGLTERLDRLGDELGGIVVFQPHTLATIRTLLDERNVPWVVIDRPPNGEPYNFVSADNIYLGRIAGRIFAMAGCKRILVLDNDISVFPSAGEKEAGMVLGMLERGGELSGLTRARCEDGSKEEGMRAVTEYLTKNDPPHAIFTEGDRLADGAMQACREAGLDVPSDVSVVGTTGLEAARHFDPPLTVAAQPMEEMGRQAVEMLVNMVRTGERRVPGRTIPGKFIVRDSVRLTEEARQQLRRDPAVCFENDNAIEKEQPS